MASHGFHGTALIACDAAKSRTPTDEELCRSATKMTSFWFDGKQKWRDDMSNNLRRLDEYIKAADAILEMRKELEVIDGILWQRSFVRLREAGELSHFSSPAGPPFRAHHHLYFTEAGPPPDAFEPGSWMCSYCNFAEDCVVNGRARKDCWNRGVTREKNPHRLFWRLPPLSPPMPDLTVDADCPARADAIRASEARALERARLLSEELADPHASDD